MSADPQGAPETTVTQFLRGAPELSISVVIPGLELHAPDLLAHSLGGSETAGLQLAAELVRQGHGLVVCGILPGELSLAADSLAA